MLIFGERKSMLAAMLCSSQPAAVACEASAYHWCTAAAAAAYACRRPCPCPAAAGLEKDNLAALIHFGSRYHEAPFIQLNCDR